MENEDAGVIDIKFEDGAYFVIELGRDTPIYGEITVIAATETAKD